MNQWPLRSGIFALILRKVYVINLNRKHFTVAASDIKLALLTIIKCLYLYGHFKQILKYYISYINILFINRLNEGHGKSGEISWVFCENPQVNILGRSNKYRL